MISIVIVCHHEFEALDQCLMAIESSTFKAKECTIVCNGSDLYEVKKDLLSFCCKVLHHPSLTVTEARNLGAASAGGDILFFTDPDVLVEKDSLQMIFNSIDNQGYDGVIGSYNLPDRSSNLATTFKTTMNHFFHQRGKDNTTFWSACGAIKKEAFDLVGGFNPRYSNPSIEDIELGYRLVEHGKTIKFDNTILVTHKKKWTLGKLLYSDIFDRAFPWTRLMFETNIFRSELNIQMRYKISLVMILGSVFMLLFDSPIALGLFTLGIILNIDIVHFFGKVHGVVYLPVTIFMLFLYYLSAGIGFLLGLVAHLRSLKSREV